jgi:hypothetical protein
MHLDGLTFASGTRFHFDLNLFDTETPAIAYLVLTFAQLAREGLGPGRRKVELTSVTQLNRQGNPSATVYENGSRTIHQNIPPLELNRTWANCSRKWASIQPAADIFSAPKPP